jgi:uncharacterized protein (TIGR02145 family)
MMKKIFTGLYALTLAFVCSCSRDDDGAVVGQASEITFSGNRVAEEHVGSDGTTTRATDATWTLGDQIGIYMLPATGTLANAVFSNRRYKYVSGKFTPDGDDQKLWYPGEGAHVKFVAYYPYSSTAATANTVSFNFADQSDRQKKEGVDFCFHRGTDEYYNTHANATHPSMQFYHKFSKIKMTVKPGTSGLNPANLTKVTLKGMPDKAVVNLSLLMSASTDNEIKNALGINTGTTTDITAYIDDATKTATQVIAEAIIAPHTVGADKKIEFTIGSETKTYTFDPAFTFESGKRYDFVFTLSAGVTPPPFPTYTEDGMTNSYMVAQNGEVSFEVSRAYEYTGSAFTDKLRVANTANYTGGFDAKVLWQDPSDLIESPTSTATAISGSGNTAIVTVKAKNSKSGNAVVGIYKTGTGILVWSYHIWVTNYMDGGTGKTVSMANGPVFMDRNLGATAEGLTSTAYGLLYQWGRKDPFPGSVSGSAGWNAAGSFSGLGSAAATSKTTNAAAIIDAIQNPMTFFRYYSSSYGHDWLPAGNDNTLWRSTNDKKTIYDPCPIGWRVPVYKSNSPSDANSPWKEYDDDLFSSNATTRTWTGTGWELTRGGVHAYYPAAGYRSYNTANAYNNGVGGLYWSASPSNNTTAYMAFTAKTVSSFENTNTRPSGFSVRCVRE